MPRETAVVPLDVGAVVYRITGRDPDRLIVLKIEINAAHADVLRSHGYSAQRSVDCGGFLLEAQAECKVRKISWEPWIETETTVPLRTAYLYTRLYNFVFTQTASVADIAKWGQYGVARMVARINGRREKDDDLQREIELGALPRSDRMSLYHCSVTDLPIEANSVDCIITDPPYPEEFLPVYRDLGRVAARVLKPGGSCVVMVGQSYQYEVQTLLRESLTYRWEAAYLTPGGQSAQLWDSTVNTFWKPLFWFVKGEYTGGWIGDVVTSKVNDNDKRFHHWGQSESGMADIVRRWSKPDDTILDPFCGAGTTGVVALDIGRKFIGCDTDAKCIADSRERINAASGADGMARSAAE